MYVTVGQLALVATFIFIGLFGLKCFIYYLLINLYILSDL